MELSAEQLRKYYLHANINRDIPNNLGLITVQRPNDAVNLFDFLSSGVQDPDIINILNNVLNVSNPGDPDYISSVSVAGNNLVFTGVGGAFSGSVAIPNAVDTNDIDYISNVELSGSNLVFSSLNNAFAGSIDLSPLIPASAGIDYISDMQLSGTDLVVTGVGSAFDGTIPLPIGSTDYITNIELSGSNLVVTGIGNAFTGSIVLPMVGGGTTDYVADVTYAGGNLTFTGIGSAVNKVLDISALDTNDIDYTSNVQLSGSDLVFTGVGNAFSGSITLPGIGGGTTDYIDNLSYAGGILTATAVGGAFAGAVDISSLDTNDIDYVNDVELIGDNLVFSGTGNAVDKLVDISVINENDIDYIDDISLSGTDLIVTSTGNAFSGILDLSPIVGNTDYVSSVIAAGSNLIFTGVGNAFSGTVAIPGVGPGAGVYTVSNGLNEAPSGNFKWGGVLEEHTTITASGLWDVQFNSPRYFAVSNTPTFFLGNTADDEIIASSATTSFNIAAGPGRILSLESTPTGQIRMITPDVATATATNGQILSLVNSGSGEVEFIDAPLSGSTDYITDVSFSGNDLIFTSTGSAFSGNVTLPNTTYSVINGLEEDPMGTFKWGGPLIGDTVIGGTVNKYDVRFDNLGEYRVFQATEGFYFSAIGGSALIASASSPNVQLNAGSGKTLDLYSPTNIKIKTPAVNVATASVGQVLKLSNVDGTVEFQDEAAAAPDTNFALNDLTADANRVHDWNAFNFEMNDVGTYTLTATGAIVQETTGVWLNMNNGNTTSYNDGNFIIDVDRDTNSAGYFRVQSGGFPKLVVNNDGTISGADYGSGDKLIGDFGGESASGYLIGVTNLGTFYEYPEPAGGTDSHYANSALTADNNYSHTWDAFDLTQSFTTGTKTENFVSAPEVHSVMNNTAGLVRQVINAVNNLTVTNAPNIHNVTVTGGPLSGFTQVLENLVTLGNSSSVSNTSVTTNSASVSLVSQDSTVTDRSRIVLSNDAINSDVQDGTNTSLIRQDSTEFAIQAHIVRNSKAEIAIAANTDDLSDASLRIANTIEFNLTGNFNLTGINTSANLINNNTTIYFYVNGGDLTLVDSSGSSALGNRFTLAGGLNKTIVNGGGGILIYDGNTVSYRLVAVHT